MTCNFVLGKSILVPIKQKSKSIPKLELQVGVIAVRLKTTIMEEINLKINKIYFSCDSNAVLNYIFNKHSNFGVYVAHRVNEIRENSSISHWQYFLSNMNVPDHATRCISFNQFGSSSSWFTGPHFLLNVTLDDFSENIISTDDIPETLIEVNVINNNLMISDVNKSIFNWEHYSDLHHSPKTQKDSLEGGLVQVLPAAELESTTILVTRLPQNASNVNIEGMGKGKQLYYLCDQLLAALIYLHFTVLILICF